MKSDDQTLALSLSFLPPSKAKSMNNYAHQTAEPSLTLSLDLSGETTAAPPDQPGSATSSHSNNITNMTAMAANKPIAVKRERQESPGTDEEEEEGGPTSTTRKKLRLTKDQSALLEDSFKQHTTLNPKQKQALADRLSLLPRQIEVWFQNRRARTKLKQTEMDCEQMKKYCDTLSEENRRLQKELQDLKALKLGQPNLVMHLATTPAATLSMCPSCCQRRGSGSGSGLGSSSNNRNSSNNPLSFTLGPGSGSKAHFYPCFPNPSAAC